MHQREDGFVRVLEGLSREDAPAIPVERLLRRLAWRRVRLVALALLLVLGSLAAVLASRPRHEPPVNLNLRLVDVEAPPDVPDRQPPELNLP